MAANVDQDDPIVQSGKIFPAKPRNPTWKLHEGKNERSYVEHVKFHRAFQGELPTVEVMISAQDVITDADHRIEVSASNIDLSGFDLFVKTWQDSEVWSVCASWFAFQCPKAPNGTILSGTQSFTSKTPQWRLDKGQGNRSHTRSVAFNPPFANPPQVFVALSKLDISNDTDLRINAQALNIQRGSFDVNVSTWADTRVNACSVAWIAFDSSYSEKQVHNLCLQSGQHSFKKTDPGYTMLNGDGDRFMKVRVNLDRKYDQSPSVLVGLSQLDVEREKDHRVCSVAENITPQSFDIKVNTWKDTRVWSATANWLAHGTSDTKREKEEAQREEERQNELKKKKEEKKHALENAGEGEEGGAKKKAKTEEEEEEKECKICFNAEINTVLVPCGHLCVCEDCSKLVTKDKNNSRCPICKASIAKVVKTFKT